MRKIKDGLIAGFIATVFLSILMIVKAKLGLLPKMNPIDDILFIADKFLGVEVTLAVGWGLHFFIGTVLWGAAYVFISPRLPGSDLSKGLMFGLIAWLAMMVAFMPMAGDGFFGLVVGPVVPVATLMLHLAYGAVLGFAYGRFTHSIS